MSSHKEYVAFVLEQLGSEEDVSSRPMMGEYLVYYRGKYVGCLLYTSDAADEL